MDEIYNLLQEIKIRPEIYLGKPSLELLKAFLDGFMHHYSYSDPIHTNNCLNGFQQFVEERYGTYTDHHWSSIIQFFNLYDEKVAFDKFYNLLNDFMKLKK